MTQNADDPMKDARERDPDFYKLIDAVMNKAQEGGVLDKKTKALILLALATATYHSGGVPGIANMARSLGAAEEEITETMRLVYVNSGMPGWVCGQAAFGDIFP